MTIKLVYPYTEIGRKIAIECDGLVRLHAGNYSHPSDKRAEGSYTLYMTPDNRRLFLEDIGEETVILKKVIDIVSFSKAIEINGRERYKIEAHRRKEGDPVLWANDGLFSGNSCNVYEFSSRLEYHSSFCEVLPGRWIFGPSFVGAESSSPAINRLKYPWSYGIEDDSGFVGRFRSEAEKFRGARDTRDKKNDLDERTHKAISDLLHKKLHRGNI